MPGMVAAGTVAARMAVAAAMEAEVVTEAAAVVTRKRARRA